jgi:hypothetical protein
MDTNLNNNISLFPNPPKYYKKFIREDEMSPPDLNFINKVSSFMSFGREYKIKERNLTYNQVDSNIIKHFDQNLIQKMKIPNSNIFNDGNFIPDLLSVENLNVDIFDAIDEEVKFLRKTYKELIYKITVLEDFEFFSCLIKFSFQKIYFFISLLKKKKIFIDILSYFNNEIEKNSKLENAFSNNLEKCQKFLQNELNRVKEEISNDRIVMKNK